MPQLSEAELVAILDSGVLRFAIPSYEDGSPMLEGDSVLAFYGEAEGVITDLLATKEQAAEWGRDSTGVMVETGGQTYSLDMEFFLQNPLLLVSRAPGS